MLAIENIFGTWKRHFPATLNPRNHEKHISLADRRSIVITHYSLDIAEEEMSHVPRDRKLKHIPYLRAHTLTTQELFCKSSDVPCIDCLTEHLIQQGRLDEQCALRLVPSTVRRVRRTTVLRVRMRMSHF